MKFPLVLNLIELVSSIHISLITFFFPLSQVLYYDFFSAVDWPLYGGSANNRDSARRLRFFLSELSIGTPLFASTATSLSCDGFAEQLNLLHSHSEMI